VRCGRGGRAGGSEALLTRVAPTCHDDDDCTLAAARDPAAEQQAQRSRELGAASVLQQDNNNPVAVLNLYVKKTKAFAEEDSRKTGAVFVHVWKYQTPLRDIRAEGSAAGKKAARAQCAENLLALLRQQHLGF
jgi:hypothetical protein